MASSSESIVTLRRNLRDVADRHKLSPGVREYLDTYFADVELTDAGDASPEGLLGAAVQHFRLGEERRLGEACVMLYTPDFDRHGWHSPHTVLDVVTDDVPFLVDSINGRLPPWSGHPSSPASLARRAAQRRWPTAAYPPARQRRTCG